MTTRRTFLKVVASASGALALGIDLLAETERRAFEPNAWVTIDADGSVVIRVGKSEMGQGVRTALPMILAEELDVDFRQVRIEQASPGPDFPSLGTGGSGSIMRSWMPLRSAGAAARAMLVAAAAARWGVAAETLETRDGMVIDRAGDRTLSYGALTADAARQPMPAEPRLKSRAEYRLVGTAQPRIDGTDIVTGRAKYGLDVRLPGMRYAVVARPPQLGGKVRRFDAAKAKGIAGVAGVYEIPTGIAVVATNSWAAMRGRDALEIEWDESPHASFDSDAHREALVAAIAEPALGIETRGEGRAGFAKAARTVEALYLYPFAAHAALEPVNCTAVVREGRCTIWSPTQAPNTVQGAAARILSIPESAIDVNVLLLGGGFGRRLGVDFDREAVEIARRMEGTPVQLLWTREDDMRHGYFQAASAHRLRAGLADDGRVVAWEHRKASTPHNARRVPTAEEKVDPQTVRGWAWGVYDSPYAIPDAEMSYAVVDAPVPIGPWRSVFSPSSVFARESFIDEIAEATGKDPLALRLELLGEERARLRAVLETVAAKSGWGGPVPAGRARGIACNVFHTDTAIAYVAEVSLRRNAGGDGLPFRVHRIVCAVDVGLAINPLGIAQQVESGVIWSLSNMKSEITVKDGAIQEANYADFPVVMIGETPDAIETHIVPSDDERPHGLGEPTVCPVAPAVANALSKLVGRRIRTLPVRVDDPSSRA